MTRGQETPSRTSLQGWRVTGKDLRYVSHIPRSSIRPVARQSRLATYPSDRNRHPTLCELPGPAKYPKPDEYRSESFTAVLDAQHQPRMRIMLCTIESCEYRSYVSCLLLTRCIHISPSHAGRLGTPLLVPPSSANLDGAKMHASAAGIVDVCPGWVSKFRSWPSKSGCG